MLYTGIASLSASHQPSTSKQHAPQIQPASPKEVSPRVNPPQEIKSPKSPIRQADRSPIRGLRQSPTPRQRIQLEKTNSKNRFSVLEAEESMECGAPPSAPSSPTSQHLGKTPSQTPKPQRTKFHK